MTEKRFNGVSESSGEPQSGSLEGMADKEREWQQFIKRFEKKTDRTGYKIEPEILDAVIAFNAIDLNTHQSCQGHSDKPLGESRMTPWIDIEASNKPKKKYLKQKKSEKELYTQYGVSESLLKKSKILNRKFEKEKKKRGIDASMLKQREELIDELIAESDISQEDLEKLRGVEQKVYNDRHMPTPEFLQWLQENEKLAKRMETLLCEFNEGRDIARNEAVKVKAEGERIEVYNGGIDYRTAEQARTDEERRGLEERLIVYRGEFKELANFLKTKFLQNV